MQCNFSKILNENLIDTFSKYFCINIRYGEMDILAILI